MLKIQSATVKDLLIVTLAYIVAIAAALVYFVLAAEPSLLLRLFIADIIGTAVIFGFSLAFRNSSFYDPYWSVAPIVLVFGFWWDQDGAILVRELLVALFTFVWGIRLTWNWIYGWTGLSHEDWRYINLKKQSGALWWPLSFLGIHLFPTVVVFLGCLSLYPSLTTGTNNPGWIDVLAFIVTASAIWLETKADLELHQFRQKRKSRQEFLTAGVWGWCRHPNYLGEIGFWVGLCLFAYAAQGSTENNILAGPLAMILLFLFVSIPMIDKKLSQDKPGYVEHIQNSFALLPFSAGRAK